MMRCALLLLVACLVASSPLKNITLTVPDGTSTHGNSNLLCTPTRWTDIIIFFLGNYVAHAATAITLPGERWQAAVATALSALFFPTSGIFRGLAMIKSFAKFGKTDLHTAARAGALCMVVRSRDWRPKAGDEAQYGVCRVPSATSLCNHLFSSRIESKQQKLHGRQPDGSSVSEEEGQDISDFLNTNNVDSIGPKRQVHVRVFKDPWVERLSMVLGRHIHGSHKLPPGYSFAVVPEDAEFDLNNDPAEQLIISNNYNLIKILVSGVQALFTSITLYRSRGDQIDRYGFAAFGLTVAPYAVMSIINLIGSAIVPSYPAMYLVASSISDEAKRRPGCHLDGLVSRLREFDDSNIDLFQSKNTHFFWIMDPVCFEKDHKENSDTDIYDAKDNNIERNLKIRFKTSIDQHLGLQTLNLESISQPDSNTLVELQPCKMDFCFSIRDKRVNRPPDSNSFSKALTIRGGPTTEPAELHTTATKAEGRRETQIKKARKDLRRGIRRETTAHKPKVAMQGEAIVFVPDSPRIKRFMEYKRKSPPYDISVVRYGSEQNWVSFESRGVDFKYVDSISWPAATLISLIPLAIIGGLSGFKRRSATLAQEVWTMTWLVWGGFVGVWAMTAWQVGPLPDKHTLYAICFTLLLCAVPTIGGFVVVGQMLAAYGSCYRFT